MDMGHIATHFLRTRQVGGSAANVTVESIPKPMETLALRIAIINATPANSFDGTAL